MKKRKFKKLIIFIAIFLISSGCNNLINNNDSSSSSIDVTSSSIDVISSSSSETYESEIVDNITFDDLQIHFIEFENSSTGDSTYIKAGDTDILIDAGSQASSSKTIIEYVNKYCSDGILEYVITTHAHSDHWSGMFGLSESFKNFKNENISRTGIYYYYKIGVIIDFALTNQNDTSTSNDYYKYKQARQYAINNNATYYNAADCFNNENNAKSTFILDESNNITLDILYNKYYFEKSSDENNYSVCCMINYNSHHFMFTGDLEKEGEEALANYYDGSSSLKTLPEVDLFKAGHHGSNTSSNDCLLSIIKPKICCVCCCAGTSEYTFNKDNSFPTQAFIDRISAYTDRVYVTSYIDEKESRSKGTLIKKSLNGSITISCNGNNIGVNATNNTIKLKDSSWFNGTIYVDDANRLYASGDKKFNYYNADDLNVKEVVRRIWKA